MKKLWIFIALWGMLVASCKDGDLWDAVHDLENRVEILEELCLQMNTNVASLQSIVNVLQDGDYITNVAPITQGDEEVGFTISFGKHSPITIYHGHSPALGVQAEDGVFYWTLDGEWLRSNGQRLKVEGEDGITPQLEIREGYWFLSTDNGTSWTQLGKATGEDGDSMFESVTQDGDYVYFVLADGSSFIISKNKSVAVLFSQQKDIPISASENVLIDYMLFGLGMNPIIEIDLPNGWKAEISSKTASTGTITFSYAQAVFLTQDIIVRVVGDDDVTTETVLSFIGNTTEELYIPDRFFKSILFSAGFDMDGDDVLTRADAIAWNNGTQAKELDISRIYITSLEGIQYFSALTKLDCSDNEKLSVLDLSGLVNLKELTCSYNEKLSALDLSGLVNLKELTCSYNEKLSALDLSGLVNLENVVCRHNQIDSLIIKDLNNLKTVDCMYNKISHLVIDNCPALVKLNCENNLLTSLDSINCVTLESLYCRENLLTTVDANKFPMLTSLGCSGDQLTNVNVERCLKLSYLDISYAQLTNLNLENNTLLSKLHCNCNSLLTNLDVTHNSALEWLDCAFCQLESLKIGDSPVLTYIRCEDNQLTTLDVSGCPALEQLSCEENQLTTLDVSHCPKLHLLHCSDNNLEILDVSKTSIRGVASFSYFLKCNMWSLRTLYVGTYPIEGITYDRTEECISPYTDIVKV